ncbi:MAG: hypothetical protein U9N54_06340 [candidate division Zixibacteria bacterium]|nr:hypothetical protein [candidate division Zixibacteria bacterium]
MGNKKFVITLIISVLVLLNGFWVFTYFGHAHKTEAIQLMQERMLINLNAQLEGLSDHFMAVKLISGKKLHDCKDDSDIHNRLILYVSEGDCYSCILELLAYFDSLENVSKDEVLVICNYKNDESYNDFRKQISNWPFTIVRDQETIIPTTTLMSPIVFTVNNESVIGNVFIPELSPQLKERYFENIKTNW